MKSQPLLIAISSPSGAGKTTLCRRLLEDLPSLRFSVSTTTRPARPKETDGVDYHFISSARFRGLINAEAFVEWAEVHDHYYGTSREEVERRRGEGHDILFDVDYQGSKQIKAAYPETISIFVLPPSIAELERRIRDRGDTSDEQVNLRLKNAREEIENYSQFDYIVINDKLVQAYEKLKGIYFAESCRGALQKEAALNLLEESK